MHREAHYAGGRHLAAHQQTARVVALALYPACQSVVRWNPQVADILPLRVLHLADKRIHRRAPLVADSYDSPMCGGAHRSDLRYPLSGLTAF